MTDTISLTSIYKRRLKKMSDLGIMIKNFKPKSFDFTRTFSNFTKDKKSITNEIKGYSRLLKDKKFVDRQARNLRAKINGFNGNFRYLIKLPDNFPKNDELRNVFLKIQRSAGKKDVFVMTSKKETFEVIDDYLDTIEGKFILVLDIEMKSRDFRRLLEKYLPKCDELVLFYSDWNNNKKNIKFAIQKSFENPEKLHMAFIPINVYFNNKSDLISTLLICSDFKSVSFIDEEFPAYLYQHIKNKPEKTPTEKLKISQWVNSVLMCFDKNYRKEDYCFDIPLTELIKKVDFKSIITFYNLEVLSREYLSIKKSLDKKKKILNLESMQSLSKSLGLT